MEGKHTDDIWFFALHVRKKCDKLHKCIEFSVLVDKAFLILSTYPENVIEWQVLTTTVCNMYFYFKADEYFFICNTIL